jgi:ethanolamine utilization protein EutQ (cupin superfamily)
MPVEELQKLVVHRFSLFGALHDSVADAVAKVVPEQLAADCPEGFLHRRHLDEDVRAVAVSLDHSLQAANLALDPAKPVQVLRLDLRIDADGLSLGTGYRTPAGRG